MRPSRTTTAVFAAAFNMLDASLTVCYVYATLHRLTIPSEIYNSKLYVQECLEVELGEH